MTWFRIQCGCNTAGSRVHLKLCAQFSANSTQIAPWNQEHFIAKSLLNSHFIPEPKSSCTWPQFSCIWYSLWWSSLALELSCQTLQLIMCLIFACCYFEWLFRHCLMDWLLNLQQSLKVVHFLYQFWYDSRADIVVNLWRGNLLLTLFSLSL